MPVTLAVFRERLAGEWVSWPDSERMTRLFRGAAGQETGLSANACQREVTALMDRAWRLLDLEQATWHTVNSVEVGSYSSSATSLRYVQQRLAAEFGLRDHLATDLFNHIDALAETALRHQARFTTPLEAYVRNIQYYHSLVTLFVDVYVPETVARNMPQAGQQQRPLLRLPSPLTVSMPSSLPEAGAFAEECFGTAKFPQEAEPASPIDLEARRRRLPKVQYDD